jgi:hypothetical protein
MRSLNKVGKHINRLHAKLHPNPMFGLRALLHWFLIGACTFSPTIFIVVSFIIMYFLLPYLFLRNILLFFSLFYPSKHVSSFSVLMNSKSKFILWRSSLPLYIIIYLLFIFLVSITYWDHTTFNLTFTWEFTHPNI